MWKKTNLLQSGSRHHRKLTFFLVITPRGYDSVIRRMKSLVCFALTRCVCFLLSLLNWKTSKERKDGKVGVGLIILHKPSDNCNNCNNAHVTELRCVIIGNFRFFKSLSK